MRNHKCKNSVMLPSKKTQFCRKSTVLSLAVLSGLAAMPTHALNVITLTQGTNTLLSFDSATPATITGTVAVTGLQPGEILRGIDFRPANGMLYGIGSTSRLYTIDSTTGAATQVGGPGPFTPALRGIFVSTDFNPVVDRLRVVTNLDQNLRIDPDTGLVVDTDAVTPGTQGDADLNFPAGDINAGENPFIAGLAYTNNVVGAASTTLYNIDFGQDFLATQGSVGGMPISPNTGQLLTVGPLNASTESFAIGFDIAANGEALAALPIGATSTTGLNSIDLATGAATMIGPIGDGRAATSGLTIIPSGIVDIAPAAVTVAEDGVSVVLTVTRSGGSTGTVTVDFSTVDGSAVATSDYTTTAGTLTFAAGVTTPQTITVPITNDTVDDESESFSVVLSNATGGVALAMGASISVISITDNDATPTPPRRGGGGGCVLSLDTQLDPTLPVLLGLAGLYLMRRRLRA